MLVRWISVLGALVGLAGRGEARNESPASPGSSASLALIENRGQWPTRAEFVGRLGPLVVRLERDAILLQLRQGAGSGALVRMAFEDASEPRAIEGVGRRPEHYGYFLGNDAAGWQRKVPAWEQAVYRDIWPGIDLVVHLHGQHLKYDVLLTPGADLDHAKFSIDGADGVRVDDDGSLVISTAAGPLIQPAPVSYEVLASGELRAILVRYRLLEGGRGSSVPCFSFVAESRDTSRPLTIDPGLIWSSYLGSSSLGSAGDGIYAITLGANGEAIVAGSADWGDFPVTPGAYSTPFVPIDVGFVSVFDPSGSSLVYSCIFGGTQPGYSPATAVAVDGTQHVVVVGSTSQKGFPTTPGAFDTVKNSLHSSAYVLKLEPDGSDLVYSTLLEGSQSEEAFAVGVTRDGAAVVGGNSVSQNFPTTPGAFDTVHGTGAPAFLCRLSPAGDSLEWSTFLAGYAVVRSIALDAEENVLATGFTGGAFPATAGAFDTTYNEGFSTVDCFVAKLSADGKTLPWGTYLGGLAEDRAHAIALDLLGGVVVTGRTMSYNFPVTPGAFQTAHDPVGGYEGFVTRLNSTGSALIYSTYLGGDNWDEPFGVAIDASGTATVAGMTANPSFPTTAGAFDTSPYSAEGFVARLSPDGTRLFYSTYLGEGGSDALRALAMDATGVVTVAGTTEGPYPVTPGCFAPTPFGGQTDGMVTRMDLLPAGAVPYGTSSPACLGPIAMGVSEMPAAGSTSFALYASGAPPSSVGLLGLGPAPYDAGIALAGILLWVDPGTAPLLLPVATQPTPYVEIPLPIPAATAGLSAYAQFVFLNTAACAGTGAFSASNALALTVQ